MQVSLEYILGFLVGLILVLAVCGVVYLVFKAKNGPANFDERQQALRGRAYRSAFWCLVAYLCLNGILDILGIRWADTMAASFIGICASMTVFVVSCVFSDAYFAVNQKPKLYLGLFAFLFILNAAILALNLINGNGLVTDGLLNFHAMNAVVLAVFFILFVSLAAKTLLEKRRGGADQ